MDNNGTGQSSLLIRQYLHEAPSDDTGAFIRQAAAALWLERRYFENMARAMGTKKDK